MQNNNERIFALDGLRGIAALSVFVQHFAADAPWHPHTFAWAGLVGVQLFFVLSGFLMGRNYSTAPISGAAVLDFWVKRVARVVPLFYICITAAYAWLWLTGQIRPFYAVEWKMWWQHYLFWNGQSVFWTIPPEMQFYLVFPLIWLLCQRLGTAANFLLILAVAICQMAAIGTPLFMAYASLFVAGVVAGRITLAPEKSYDVPFVVLIVFYVISWPGMIDVLGLPKSLYSGLSQGPLYLIYLPALVLVATASPLAWRLLGRGVLRRYGDMSYSVYLLHGPIYFGLKMWTPIALLPAAIWFLLTLAVVTVVSHYSFRYVETPLRRRISRLAPKPPANAPLQPAANGGDGVRSGRPAPEEALVTPALT
ncbi:acyltransferase family protein [Mesorhizobium newzealandense]|uniref:Acyltransferase family protein n=1 Tax=Mesorhizobium newzealandense TaxID=1300302 RepID=A0ABW4UJM6_9HYPH